MSSAAEAQEETVEAAVADRRAAMDPGHARAMAAGEDRAWVRWSPEFLPADEVHARWDANFRARNAGDLDRVLQAYTHFPYCRSSCSFCMYWHQEKPRGDQYAPYVDGLAERLESQVSRVGRIETMSAYWGGGTPTAAPIDVLQRYLAAHAEAFSVRAYHTVEAHPTTLDPNDVATFAASGVNRMSMGVQSFDPAVLGEITRSNGRADRVEDIVRAAHDASIQFNLDLVLGLPRQTAESFQADLLRLAAMRPMTISAYLYQPVTSLPARPEESIGRAAYTPEVIAAVEAHGMKLVTPNPERSLSVLFVRDDAAIEEQAMYCQFDSRLDAVDTFAIGSASVSHLWGYAWYREVTDPAQIEDPAYWGTRISERDELWKRTRHALCSGMSVTPSLFADASRPVWPDLCERLDPLVDEGFLEKGADSYVVMDGESERLIDRLIAFNRQSEPTNTTPPESAHPTLHAAGSKPVDEATTRLLVELCEALDVPNPGRRFRGGWLKEIDARSLFVSLGDRDAEPLRVIVSDPEEPCFVRTARFGLSYSGDTLPEDHAVFLREMAAELEAQGL